MASGRSSTSTDREHPPCCLIEISWGAGPQRSASWSIYTDCWLLLLGFCWNPPPHLLATTNSFCPDLGKTHLMADLTLSLARPVRGSLGWGPGNWSCRAPKLAADLLLLGQRPEYPDCVLLWGQGEEGAGLEGEQSIRSFLSLGDGGSSPSVQPDNSALPRDPAGPLPQCGATASQGVPIFSSLPLPTCPRVLITHSNCLILGLENSSFI